MIFVELTKLCEGEESPIEVNPGAILSYEEYDNHCVLYMFYGRDTLELHVKETYEEVNEMMRLYERINDDRTMCLNIGIAQYIDFLNNTKTNPLRDEYLKWKGRNELLSKKRWIDADELLEHVGRDKLDTRELICDLVEKLVIKESR